MKTITFNDTNISAYTFEDSDVLTATPQNITCPDFIIGDLNSTNATIHDNVTPPADWQSWRYTFDGTTWAEVADWVDPRLAEIARLEEEIARLKAE
jgi:hypothetical protein